MAKAKPGPGDEYERHRDRMAGASRERSASGRDIGPLPKVKNARRKAKCKASLRLFCETYFPRRFRLAWSAAHLVVLDRLQACIRDGGLFANAMPRGSGKTTMAEAAALWGVLYGYRRFVMLIGATQTPHAEGLLNSIRAEVEANDLLLEDFPEACFPVRALEGITQRANAQTLGGKRTDIEWTGGELVLPTVPGAACSGAIVAARGITGAIRGAKRTAPDGEQLRPDCVIIDDPQTKESARSLTQCAYRESVIEGDILGLAGPDKTIAAVMPCTVVTDGDLADRFLDRDKHPEWQGERSRMLVAMPADLKLWDEYGAVRAAALKAGRDPAEATAFYAANRAAMDAGAEAGWPARMKAGELSAVQSAMNLYLRNPREFLAEYQNAPQKEAAAARRELDADALAGRLTNVPRGEVPRECTRLTAFVDCGAKVLWYAVVGWDERFGGAVVDCGPWPAQNRSYFAAADARPALEDVFPGMDEEARLYAGLKALTGELLGRAYPRHQTGQPARVDLGLVDSGWQTDVVFKLCRESPHAAVLMPSKGYSVGSNARPMAEWPVRPGERVSPFGSPPWRVGPVGGAGRGRQALFDADAWKSFAASRLATPPGGHGAVMLYGDRPFAHQLLADHLTAEFAEPVTARGRTYDKWQLRPGRDNHLWDAVAGAAVAASVHGLRWSAAAAAGEADPADAPRKRVSLGDIARRKAAARAAAGG